MKILMFLLMISCITMIYLGQLRRNQFSKVTAYKYLVHPFMVIPMVKFSIFRIKWFYIDKCYITHSKYIIYDLIIVFMLLNNL